MATDDGISLHGGAIGSPDHVCATALVLSCPPAGLLREFSSSRGGRLGGDFVPAVTMLPGAGTKGTETVLVLLQLPVSCYGLQK